MRSEDERFYEAILCTLIAKAGGSIRLDAADIAAWGNATQLCAPIVVGSISRSPPGQPLRRWAVAPAQR